MKLLGWMHRKFRQNSGGDVFREDYVASGPWCNCFCARPSLEEHHHGRPRPMGGNGLFAEEVFGGEKVLFEGLLSIGTLGSGPFEVDEEETAGVVTPAFGEPVTVEAIAEKQEEVELKVLRKELEKVLATEADKEGGDRFSSARPSHASGKGVACPLQGYLFGSPIEVAETAGQSDHRASLGELFMMSPVAEEEEGGGKGEEAAAAAEEAGRDLKSKAWMYLLMMKKMLRGPSSASSSSGVGPGDTRTVGTRFHKKVHPENTITPKKLKRSYKHKNRKGSPTHDGGNDSYGGGDTLTTSKGANIMERNLSFKSRLIGDGSELNGSRGYWIRTDSDYLVLEL